MRIYAQPAIILVAAYASLKILWVFSIPWFKFRILTLPQQGTALVVSRRLSLAGEKAGISEQAIRSRRMENYGVDVSSTDTTTPYTYSTSEISSVCRASSTKLSKPVSLWSTARNRFTLKSTALTMPPSPDGVSATRKTP